MSISTELEKMSLYENKCGKRMCPNDVLALRVNKSGWVGLSANLVREYELNGYRMASFYFKDGKIGLKLYRNKREGQHRIRHNSFSNVMGYGLYVINFVKAHPEYLGTYWVGDREIGKGYVAFLAEKH